MFGVTESSSLYIEGSDFQVNLNKKSFITIFYLKNNYAQNKGGIFFLLLVGMLGLKNNTFFNNTSIEGGVFYSCENNLVNVTIDSCYFNNNSADLSLFSLENTILSIYNSSFINNINNIFSLTESSIQLINISISQHFCKHNQIGCLLISEKYSKIFIRESIFSNISSSVEGNFHLLESEFEILNTTVWNVFSEKFKGSSISAISSKIFINNSNFQQFDSNFFYLTYSEILIYNSSFIANSHFSHLQPYGTLYCESCSSFQINSSYFNDNKFIASGGAIYLYQGKDDKNTEFYIDKCLFYNNDAFNYGGAIFLFNTNLTISNSIFYENTALKGGAIYYDADQIYSNLFLINNSFINNSALSEGGAIKWTYNEPIYNSTNFFNTNKAKYGNDTASFPVRINLKIYGETYSNLLHESNVREIPILNQILSGDNTHYVFSFDIVDFYNITVSSIDSNM